MSNSTLNRQDETVRKHVAVVTKEVAAAPSAEKSPAVKIDAASQTPQQFMDSCEEAIRELAYQKWEEAGCPTGEGFEFWVVAEREVVAARSDAMSMRP